MEGLKALKNWWCEEVFPEQRMVWPISIKKVGFPRISYAVLVFLISIFTLSYIAFSLIEGAINTLKVPFGPEFSIGFGLSSSTSLLLLFIPIIVTSMLILYVVAINTDRPNSTWFEIQAFGSKTVAKTDYVIVTTAVVFFIFKLIWGDVEWYHLLIFLLIISAPIVNRFTRKEISIVCPAPCPEPKPIEEADIIPQDVEEPKTSGNYLYRSYYWSSRAGNYKIDNFPLAQNDYLSAQEESKKILESIDGYSDQDYVYIVQNGLTDDLCRLINKIAKMHKNARNIERIDNLLQFVHNPNFTFSHDQESKGINDYARFPIETLVDKTGDCECLAILAVSLFKLHGYRAALIRIPGHCMAGVEVPEEIDLPGTWVEDEQGVRYFICEATGSGWQIGEKDDDFLEVRAIPV